VLGTTYFTLATEQIQELRDSDTGGMAHGGEFETSLMLAVRPDLVAEDGWDAPMWDEHYDWGGRDLIEGGPLSVYRPFDAYSDSGAIGAPKEASAEKGERIREIIGTELAAIFVAIHEANQ
jgi:creatinine amidohydrolase